MVLLFGSCWLVISTHLYPCIVIDSSVAVLWFGPCPCWSVYRGESGANHVGQTCVAAPLSIIISTLLSLWTAFTKDAVILCCCAGGVNV